MCVRCGAVPVVSSQERSVEFCECEVPRPTPSTENVCCLNCGHAIQAETSSFCECDDPDPVVGETVVYCRNGGCDKVIKDPKPQAVGR